MKTDPIHTENRGDNRSDVHNRTFTVTARATVSVQRDGHQYVATLRQIGNWSSYDARAETCIEPDLGAAIDATLLSSGMRRVVG